MTLCHKQISTKRAPSGGRDPKLSTSVNLFYRFVSLQAHFPSAESSKNAQGRDVEEEIGALQPFWHMYRRSRTLSIMSSAPTATEAPL
jgi:hypothetical protein